METRILPDLEAVSREAAELFVREAGRAVRVRGRFAVALSGGETPRRAYELLAEPARRDRVDWARVHVFWGDERYVPPDDPRSNFRAARLALLDRVPLRRGQVHPIRCEGRLASSVREYEALLRSFSGEGPLFELVFLGLGEDGHTASLFPDSPALGEERWVAAASGPDADRVTLTPAALNRSEMAVFLVAGAAKAAALRALVAGAPEVPASAIRPRGELWCLADRAAASLLAPDRREGAPGEELQEGMGG